MGRLRDRADSAVVAQQLRNSMRADSSDPDPALASVPDPEPAAEAPKKATGKVARTKPGNSRETARKAAAAAHGAPAPRRTSKSAGSPADYQKSRRRSLYRIDLELSAEQRGKLDAIAARDGVSAVQAVRALIDEASV